MHKKKLREYVIVVEDVQRNGFNCCLYTMEVE